MNWRQAEEVGAARAIRAMGWLVRHLPRRATRWVVVPIAGYYLLAARQAMRASRDYLQRVLGRPPTLAERFRHVHTFALCTLDRAYLMQNCFDEYEVQVGNPALTAELSGQRDSAFLVGAHLGSFEVLHAMSRTNRGRHTYIVMYEDNAQKINAVLRELNPALFDSIISLGRPASMLRVREVLEEGAFVSLLADRSLSSGRPEDVLMVPFLGEPAPFPLGPFRMAAMLRQPVVLMLGVFLGGNRYRILFERIHDFSAPSADRSALGVAQSVRAYVARIDAHCRTHPYNWFNFYDFWRAAPAASESLSDSNQ